MVCRPLGRTLSTTGAGQSYGDTWRELIASIIISLILCVLQARHFTFSVYQT